MIRREATGSDGRPCWLLISQIEHARVAGELAAAWGASPYAAPQPRDELLLAIIRHDDGWCGWERRPEVDSSTGRPRDFTEMPLDESLVIWRDSIERVAQLTPLGGYAVAGHFLNLLTHSMAWQAHGNRAAAATHQWAAEFQARQCELLDECRALAPDEAVSEVADRAVAWLQFFDRLSLWLCVAEQTAPMELPTPGGVTLRLDPENPQRIVLDPWPLRANGLELLVSGRTVPQRRYASSEELAAVFRDGTGEPEEPVIRLELVPSRKG